MTKLALPTPGFLALEVLLVFSGFTSAFFSAFSLNAETNKPVFNGKQAFADCRTAVAFGERPSGSTANSKLREWIVGELKPLGGQLTLDTFTANTPSGPLPMTNIIYKLPGRLEEHAQNGHASGRDIAITGHFDTKKIPMVNFVGANDAGSSTGFLVEFARVMAKTPHADDLYIVFFDGEEAVGEWTDTDSIYGSKHLDARWAADGTLGHLDALINADMIGDKDLDIMNDGNSNSKLVQGMLGSAAKLGDAKYFHTDRQGIEDDHIPFGESGVNVLDIIDFTYGPNNAYWHTAKDTMDKLSPQSFQIVGDVVVDLVRSLDHH